MKKLISKLFVPAFVFLSLGLNGQGLQDYATIAEQDNPGLKAKYAEFEVAMQQLPQVSSLPNPSLTVAAFGQMVETRVGQQMARFSFSQMFPWFGTIEARKNVAAARAEATYQSYLDAKAELASKVRIAYYPLVELEQLILLQKENIEILSTFKTLATSNFQNGRGSLSDALRVDLMSNEAKTEIQILEQKKKPLEFYFNTLLNRDKDESVIIADSFSTPEKRVLDADSIARHPRLEALRKQREMAMAQEILTTKQGAPEFGLGFEYIVTAARPEVSIPGNGKDAYMPMVTLSLPIYRKQYKAAAKESRLMQTAYSEMENNEANNLLSEFEMTRFEMDKSLIQLELFETQTKQIQQIIDLSLASLSTSGTDFEEILRLQQQLIKYKMNRVSALKDYYAAESRMFFLTGF